MFKKNGLSHYYVICETKNGVMNLERAVGKAVSIPIYTWTKKGLPSIMYAFLHATWTPSPYLHVIHNGNRRLASPLPPLGVYVTNGRPQMGNNLEGILREMTNELNSN